MVPNSSRIAGVNVPVSLLQVPSWKLDLSPAGLLVQGSLLFWEWPMFLRPCVKRDNYYLKAWAL